MQLSLKTFLSQQQASIIRAFNTPSRFPIGIKYPDNFPHILNRGYQVTFDVRVKNKRAFIRRDFLTGEMEYWVHIKYTRYRKAFLAFIEHEYGVISLDVGTEWHVDHMLSRSFANKYDINYVRLCLISKFQNIAYGRKFERKMLATKQNGRTIYLINYLCAMKVLGIDTPRDRCDYALRKRSIIEELQKKGISFFNTPAGEYMLDDYFRFYDII